MDKGLEKGMSEFDERNSITDIPAAEPSQESDSGPLNIYIYISIITLFIVLGVTYTMYRVLAPVLKETFTVPDYPSGFHDPLWFLRSTCNNELDPSELPRIP